MPLLQTLTGIHYFARLPMRIRPFSKAFTANGYAKSGVDGYIFVTWTLENT